MNQQGGPIRAEQVHIFLRMPRIGDVHVPQRALIMLSVGFRAVCTVYFVQCSLQEEGEFNGL